MASTSAKPNWKRHPLVFQFNEHVRMDITAYFQLFEMAMRRAHITEDTDKARTLQFYVSGLALRFYEFLLDECDSLESQDMVSEYILQFSRCSHALATHNHKLSYPQLSTSPTTTTSRIEPIIADSSLNDGINSTVPLEAESTLNSNTSFSTTEVDVPIARSGSGDQPHEMVRDPGDVHPHQINGVSQQSDLLIGVPLQFEVIADNANSQHAIQQNSEPELIADSIGISQQIVSEIQPNTTVNLDATYTALNNEAESFESHVATAPPAPKSHKIGNRQTSTSTPGPSNATRDRNTIVNTAPLITFGSLEVLPKTRSNKRGKTSRLPMQPLKRINSPSQKSRDVIKIQSRSKRNKLNAFAELIKINPNNRKQIRSEFVNTRHATD